jgi:hypothetical protein
MGNTRYEGFPKFRHSQWTIEGEIERLGAFASGARRARGPKRWMAYALVITFVAPLVLATIGFFMNFV